MNKLVSHLRSFVFFMRGFGHAFFYHTKLVLPNALRPNNSQMPAVMAGICVCQDAKNILKLNWQGFFCRLVLVESMTYKSTPRRKSAKMRKKTANQSHFLLSLSSASGFLVFRDFGRYSFFQIGFSKKAVSVKRELLRGNGDKNGTPKLVSEAR